MADEPHLTEGDSVSACNAKVNTIKNSILRVSMLIGILALNSYCERAVSLY